MAVGGRCSGGRGVCEPLATLGCDGHAVNDTMLAHGQLLVDDPERIGPIQAIGMDQTLFNREYRTQQRATTFDSPLKPEEPSLQRNAPCPRRRTPGHRLGRSEQTQPAVEITLLSA
ncbi:MAG: hypothetical protein H6524_09090 [Actinobacteria bacterium]|nr:hypothetical protein [Actinomycetota bacterium]MCO5298717.1 hypothetical protein [Candidatus Nanopelagicales bacterium]